MAPALNPRNGQALNLGEMVACIPSGGWGGGGGYVSVCLIRSPTRYAKKPILFAVIILKTSKLYRGNPVTTVVYNSLNPFICISDFKVYVSLLYWVFSENVTD